MPIQAVIFDFGGVLMRTHDYAGRQKWADRLGLSGPDLEKAIFESEAARRAMVGEVPFTALRQHVATVFRLDGAESDRLWDDFWAGDRLDRELVDFLAGLRPRYRTAILSNAWSDARDLFTERLGLDRAVDLMVISAEEGLAKPDARIYQCALDRLQVRPEEAVFVDDFAVNVEAACALGIHGILFRSTEQVLAAVRQQLDGTGAGCL